MGRPPRERDRDCAPRPIPANRIAAFRRRLLGWYKSEGRVFPWRQRARSKYQQVVAELLLQRTRAEAVAAFFPSFGSTFPSWASLEEASEGELRNLLAPIGLWRRRATALKGLASELVRRGSRFPRNRDEIESLPGVGQYIANAILLLVYGIPEPLLDGGMARVLERYFGPRRLADIRFDDYLQTLSRRVVSQNDPMLVNWAVLDLGAKVCTSRNPRCDACPVRGACTYARQLRRQA